MGRIVTFHGTDHKAGVSQTALGTAESLAENPLGVRLLFIPDYTEIGRAHV